ncbi:transmembrane protein 107 isoform X1 [Sorex araneus]|uniref:transmembrane protein 107 isoform X1 n=1 Tax=Sorex araneus TaxID=42254 RepID=UPI002433972F|nr:transmembrane protein 107 isoform X1 [Sorex araneus]
MGQISELVPSRFLTLLAHLVIVITLFWSRDSNVEACLPLAYTAEEYEKQDIQLVIALSVTLGLFAVELAGFLSGVSMFNSTQSIISIGAHCSASVALSFFISERWECTTYWYIFAFCRDCFSALNLNYVQQENISPERQSLASYMRHNQYAENSNKSQNGVVTGARTSK